MDQLSCLPLLLACCSILSWMVPLAGAQETSRGLSPPAPRLSLSPAHSIFFPGEWVHLQCSPPGGVRASGFQFLRRKADGEWDQVKQGTENTLEVFTVRLRSQEAYVCSYLEERSTGKWSSRSKEVAFSVTDRPPPPVFSITPKRVFYIRGESIDITCSAPDQRSVSKIFLFKDTKQLPLINTSTFKVTLRLDPQDTGWYSCRYWVMESGQEIPAQETNPIYVSVRDYLPSPVLSVTPNQNIYISGESINLTCSAPNKHYVLLSLFSKDGHLINASPSLLTRRLSPQDGGRYSCNYIGVESGREISSWESKVLHVKVMGPLPVWIRYLVVAGLFFVINSTIYLVTCYCIHKRRDEHNEF